MHKAKSIINDNNNIDIYKRFLKKGFPYTIL